MPSYTKNENYTLPPFVPDYSVEKPTGTTVDPYLSYGGSGDNSDMDTTPSSHCP